jgi:DedD protein
MAFFKFRKSGDDQPGQAPQSESVEALRKRATFRLIGTAVLVLAGVIGFPMLFDSQPRPIPVDIAIEIPDKAKVKPLVMPAAPAPALVEPAPAAAQKPAAIALLPPSDALPSPGVIEKKLSVQEYIKEKQDTSHEKAVQLAPKKEEKIETKSSIIKEKSKINENDAARAVALLEGKTPDVASEKAGTAASPAPATAAISGEGRFVVQVGAYSDAARVKEARAKLESAGLKTYAQVVDTKDGQRTRVRVGPFSDKAEADRAAQKVKALDLPAVILSL